MAGQKRAKRTHVSVAMRLPNGERFSDERLLNISLGGVFIDMPDPLPFGAGLKLDFTLPGKPKKIISCEGFVIWSTKTKPDKAGGLSGVGVRLEKIDISEMRALAEAVGGKL